MALTVSVTLRYSKYILLLINIFAFFWSSMLKPQPLEAMKRRSQTSQGHRVAWRQSLCFFSQMGALLTTQ